MDSLYGFTAMINTPCLENGIIKLWGIEIEVRNNEKGKEARNKV
jgi:hypothetical protein